MSKFETISEAYHSKLKIVFTKNQSDIAFKEATNGITVIGESLKKKILKKTLIDLDWEDNPHQNLYCLPENSKQLTTESFLQAWSMSGSRYVSHSSAMYYLGILLQRPRDFHITNEDKSKSSILKNVLTDQLIKQAFMKGPRKTKQLAYYKGLTFYFHEKVFTNLIGTHSFNINDVEFKISDLERTFLDVVFAPHYGGGIPTILDSFLHSGLDVTKILQYYKELNPIYPMWQRVGFVLDALKQGHEDYFKNCFGKPKNKFYLDFEFRDSWVFNEKWQIYHPRGITI